MPRKHDVVRDELELRGGGVYCVMPYESKDKKKRCIFKIGMTSKSFSQRIDQYNSYYPLGVYLVSFLQSPPVKGSGHRKKKPLYLEIERFVMDKIIEKGGYQIHSTARIRNMNEDFEGETEFFYTSEKVIRDSFKQAFNTYKGQLHQYTLDEINDRYEELLADKPNYEANIVYPTG